MTKRILLSVTGVSAAAAALGGGGYLWYLSQFAESDASIRQALMRNNLNAEARWLRANDTNRGGAPDTSTAADDPEGTRLLDELETELQVYERAAREYKQDGGLATMGAFAASQGKMLRLVQSVRERSAHFSAAQARRVPPLIARSQAVGAMVALPQATSSNTP